jgi:chromosome partitioning protein
MADIIVVGNEKGGAGKSTLAIHLMTALLHEGARIGALDLDVRQQSLAHFIDNRAAWLAANAAVAPMPETVRLDAAIARAPDDEARARLDAAFEALSACDLIVTPMNDSFVDFDTLGVVDPVTLELKRPSLYSETVWNSRKDRALASGRSIDWVVLRNRLAPADARNRRRVDERVQALSRRAGFRVGPGLRDRVIYRELFPFGLTIADLSPSIRPVSMSLQHVAARQELRDLMGFLGLTPDGAQLAAQ